MSHAFTDPLPPSAVIELGDGMALLVDPHWRAHLKDPHAGKFDQQTAIDVAYPQIHPRWGRMHAQRDKGNSVDLMA